MTRRPLSVLFVAALLVGANVHAQALLEPPPAPAAQPAPSAAAAAIKRMDSVPALVAQGRRYLQAKDLPNYTLVLQRLVELRPFLGSLRYELAVAYAMQDMKAEAYDVL